MSTATKRLMKPSRPAGDGLPSTALGAKAIDPAACVAALERLLNAQLDGYTRLLAVIERQRQAIRGANTQALEQAAREEETLVHTLATIDAQRTQVLALGFREKPARGDVTPTHLSPTLSDVLEHAGIDDDVRSRVLGLAADLREKVASAKRCGAIVRDAAAALSRHMAGIQQTVHSALSRARVYERRGRLNPGSAMPATVDMKS
jgi:hypothetical protein